MRCYSQPKGFLAVWAGMAGDGADRLHHFQNYWTPWCYKTTRCVRSAWEGGGKSGHRCSLCELGFQRPSLTAQVLQLGETASLKGKHSNLGSLEEMQHQE